MKRSSIHVGVDTKAQHPSFVNDALALADLATKSRYGHVDTLTDADATKGKLSKRIQEHLKSLGAGDLLLLTISAHGSSDGAVDEFLSLAGGTLNDNELEALLRMATERGIKVVLLVDACESQGVWALDAAPPLFAPSHLESHSRGLLDVEKGAKHGGPQSKGSLLSRIIIEGESEETPGCDVIEIAAARKDDDAHFGKPAFRRGCRDMSCFSSAVCAVAYGEGGSVPRTWEELYQGVRTIVMNQTGGKQNPSYMCGGFGKDHSVMSVSAGGHELDDIIPFPFDSA